MPKNRPGFSERGFTLIELLMAIVVLGIISSAVAMIFYQGAKSFQVLDTRMELSGQGTLAIERLSREMRLIRCTVSGNDCNPSGSDITAMTATELRFVNTDSIGRGFRLDAGALKLRQGSTAGDPEDVLCSNVASLAFEYLKKDGSAASAPAEVWTINVSMNLAKGTDSVDFKASVHPRSFR